ncbi:MAG: hypothetical protein ACM3VS_12710 [Candidatus Dadabacteria bacterium]
MRYLIVVLLLVSCSKEIPLRETEGLRFQAEGKSYFYSKPIVSAEPFCGKTLYSITGTNDPSEKLLLSIVTNNLTPGTYDAGLSYWGKHMISNNITLNVISCQNGILTATFSGTVASGELLNVHLN